VNANTSIGESQQNCIWDVIVGENYNTTQTYPCNFTTCERPIWSEEYASVYKPAEDRLEVEPDDYFIGCYFGYGWVGSLYTEYNGFLTAIMATIPYTHFLTVWANIVGFNAMPDREFTFDEMSLSTEKLANASLGIRGPELNQGTTLYEQGVTALLNYYTSSAKNPETGYWDLYNCPFSNATDGFCQYLNACNGSEEQETPSSNATLLIQCLLAVGYTLMAAYWTQVIPGGNGAREKFYFPFLPSYWFGGTRPKRNDIPEGGAGVATDFISKAYKETKAVDGVNMTLNVGEVTALLGHNGAGKTTMSHMLCCETLPTSGSASVFGLSVANEPFIVRQLVGVCKQDDYLYPNLTAREHLELFAGLRGVSGDDIGGIVQEWLESVDLHLVQDQYSSGFSGGMKRRLSVACSTIGERPFIILDEPTTGMDPVSRRFVWKHVDRIKDGRVVLLTTHAMEEADLLADNVIIMRKGNIAASGSPLELKAEHGSSLQFSLLVEQNAVEEVADLVHEKFAKYEDSVNVEAGGTGNIVVAISKIREGSSRDGVDVDALVDFVSFMDSNEAVKEYGFSNSSLEEVFLKVTEGDEEETEGDEEEETGKDVDESQKQGDDIQMHPSFDKEDDEIQANADAVEVIDDMQSARFKGANEIGSFEANLTLKGQLSAFATFLGRRDWLGKSSIANWIFHSLGILMVFIFGFSAADTSNPYYFLALPTFVVSFTIFTIVTPIYHERSFGLLYLIRSQGMLKSSYLIAQITYAFLASLCFTLVVLSLLYATPMYRDSVICDDFFGDYTPRPPLYATESCAHSFGDPQKINQGGLAEIPWDDEYNGEPVELFVRRAPAGYAWILGTIAVFSVTMPGIVLSALHLPGFKMAATALTFMVLFSVATAVIIFGVFQGRGDEDNEECFYDICNKTFQEFENQTTIEGEDFLNCAGFAASQSTIGALCAPSISALLPQYGVLQGMGLTWMAKVTFDSYPSGYVDNILMPRISGDYCDGSTCEFPFVRDVYGENLGYTVLGGVLLAILGFLLVSMFTFPAGFVLVTKMAIANFIDRVMHPCRSTKGGDSEEEKAVEVAEEVQDEQRAVRAIVQPFIKPPSPDSVEKGDDDDQVVVPDHDSIPRDEVPPVLAYKLRKEYPTPSGLPTKVALKSLELQVPKGEVLGLLGKNGAGKTTALKIFAGAHESTSGLALVAGYDISSEQLRVFERLGNCAQFDCIWEWQSIKCHLEFFGGLKGLPKDRVKDVALSVAQSVGLGAPEVYTRRAGALSGGMRRRLSIAISLIGAPLVLLLDEPTTGLDPSTRNSIWDLVNSFATERRSIIITTHMMLEADTLCSRIAIMANGSLRTIGTQQWLKGRYGSGYLLQLNLVRSSTENQDRAMEFVRSKLHPDAILQSRQAKTLHVALPRDASLAKVFRVLYSPESREAGINQFLFSQSSLEDVFVSLGE